MSGNIPSSSKFNTGKKTGVEYVEDDVYELPESDFSKSAAIVFDKTDHGKAGVIPLSIFLT